MVIPLSRSRSMESKNCSRISLGSTAPVSSRTRSDSVDFPWSTWLMIEKLRIESGRVTWKGLPRAVRPAWPHSLNAGKRPPASIGPSLFTEDPDGQHQEPDQKEPPE